MKGEREGKGKYRFRGTGDARRNRVYIVKRVALSSFSTLMAYGSSYTCAISSLPAVGSFPVSRGRDVIVMSHHSSRSSFCLYSAIFVTRPALWLIVCRSEYFLLCLRMVSKLCSGVSTVSLPYLLSLISGPFTGALSLSSCY